MTPTPYDDIYGMFLSKTEDYDIAKRISEDPDKGKELLLEFLVSAIPKFTYSIKNLSDRSDLSHQFNIYLSDLEKEILAVLMVVEYMSPKMLRSDLLENTLGSKDFKSWSPANQIKEIRAVRETYQREANSLMTEYYYRQGYEV